MKSSRALDQLLPYLQIEDEIFWEPVRLARPGAWSGHLATAFWLTKIVRPNTFVELGTHSGNSYSAFCQAISRLGLSARAFAIDTWLGDEHAGFYDDSAYRRLVEFNESHYASFSKLLRTTFDDARGYFQDGSVDLLHIDGLHSYDAVKHDFDIWKSALSDRGVVVFHDTNVRERDFGVWQLWLELAEAYPSFEFHHSEGLGVLGVGQQQPEALQRLFELKNDPETAGMVRRIFAARGELFRSRSQVLDLSDHCNGLEAELKTGRDHISVLERQYVDLDRVLKEHIQALSSKDESLRSKDESLRSLELQLANRDAVLAERQRELQQKAEVINNLQRRLVEHEYKLRGSEDELRLANQALSTKQSEIAQANEAAAQLREQMAQSARTFDEERRTAAQYAGHLLEELSSMKRELGLIEGSSTWKAVSRIRASFQNYPRFRRFVRRVGRIIWWTVTFQLFARLRDRRQLLHTRDLVARSALFDASWYIERYPEIAEFGDPALHYTLFGAAERRNPCPDFDAQDYLKRYPDVAESGMNPLVHYLEYGASEGRRVCPVGAADDALADAAQPSVEPPKRDYATWVNCYDSLTQEDRASIASHIAHLTYRPLISIVMPVFNTNPRFLRSALDSVLDQLYSNWELCIADDASTNPETIALLAEYSRKDTRIKVVFRATNGHISAASNSALELATGEFIALMDHDDELAPHALYMVVVELSEHPEADVIYSDEDHIDEYGTRSEPHFKPEWNLELLHSYNFINHLGVYRASLIHTLGGFREGFEGSQDYDLALRIVDETTPERIHHIPHVLYHWRIIPSAFSSTNLNDAGDAGRRALAEHFARRGENVRLAEGRRPFITRVIRPLPEPHPLVSLIVPTRDRLQLLRTCIDGILHKTNYSNLELLVVDNESCEPETIAYLQSISRDPRVRVLHIPGPFNFSALNNAAVASAAGDIIGFINNDIEVIEPHWLEEMVSQAVQPGVGAVGAKLLYPDGRVQHAGVVLGVQGVAGHSHKYFPGSAYGYFCRLQLIYNVSCVTAACMLMPKKVFQEVHGYDEVNLTVAFNDVDLCLKIRQAGYNIVWTPFAELYHHESASRGSDEAPDKIERAIQEREYMQKRWGDVLLTDPFYSPNLTLDHEDYTIAFPPRTIKPWRAGESAEFG